MQTAQFILGFVLLVAAIVGAIALANEHGYSKALDEVSAGKHAWRSEQGLIQAMRKKL